MSLSDIIPGKIVPGRNPPPRTHNNSWGVCGLARTPGLGSLCCGVRCVPKALLLSSALGVLVLAVGSAGHGPTCFGAGSYMVVPPLG